jgi:hypothetical protein
LGAILRLANLFCAASVDRSGEAHKQCDRHVGEQRQRSASTVKIANCGVFIFDDRST